VIGTLSAPFQRALAVTVLLFILSVIWGGVVRPLAGRWEAWNTEIENGEKLLDGYQSAGASQAELQTKISALQQILARQHPFLEGTSSPLVAAKMQGDLKAVVEAAGGQLRSVQVLPAATEGGIGRVGVRADIGATVESLEKILYEIEHSTPLLLIDSLEIQAPENGQDGPGHPVPLTVRFDVYGYLPAVP
jgi:hypothetical protein